MPARMMPKIFFMSLLLLDRKTAGMTRAC